MAATMPRLFRVVDSYRLYLQSQHSVRLGRYYDVAVAILYIAFCCVYVVNTAYLENSPAAMDTVELILAIIFLCSWMMELFAASSRLRFLITARSLFALLAVIPVMATIQDQNSYVGGGPVFPFIYPCRFIACYVMVASCLVRGDESLLPISQLKLSIAKLLLTIVFLILTTAAFIQIIVIKSNQVETLNFFESFFYTVIVLFTVGYVDDVLPQSVFARIVILVAIMFGAVYIPAKVADIYQLVQEQSAFSGRFVGFSKEELRDGYSHIVVCGVWRSAHLRNFVRRLLALGGGSELARAKVVILGKSEPDEELLNLLHDPLYVERVVYIKGSVLHVPDCQRACLRKAQAVFILSDNHKASPNRVDAEVIMRAVAVHHYDPMSRILVKLQMPQNLFHLTWGGVEQVVCVDELKMGLLAQSCLCPGFSTLLYTIGCPYIGESGSNSDQREKEFVYGAAQELYVENPPDYFIGKSFSVVALDIFQMYSAVLLAVAAPSNETGQGRLDLLVNPTNYCFTGDEQIILLTRSCDVASAISRLPRQRPRQNRNQFVSVLSNVSEATPLVTHAAKAETDGGKGHLRSQQSRVKQASMSQTQLTSLHGKQQVLGVCDPVMTGKSRSFIKHLVDSDLLQAPRQATDEADGQVTMSWEYICSGKSRLVNLSEAPWSLKDHIVLCDNSDGFPRNLGFFLAPLRARHQTQHLPVVVLNPSLPSADQWKLLTSFREVYFVQGSPLEPTDLKRAAIGTACRSVMVSDCTIDSLRDPDNTVDAISLLAAHNIHSQAKSTCFMINELVQNSNMDLLIPHHSACFHTGSWEHAKGELSLPFMSGHAFSSTMLDSLLCSAHTNPLLLSFVRTLLFSGCLGTGDGEDEQDHCPENVEVSRLTAASAVNHSAQAQQDGRPTSQGILLHIDHLDVPILATESSRGSSTSDEDASDAEDTPCSVLQPRVVDPQELFEESPIYQQQTMHSLPKVHLNLNEASRVMQQPIPSRLAGSTYGNLFQHCLHGQSSLALGLWRLAPDGLHYVATNPRPETVLRSTDCAFLLKASAS